MGIPLINIVAVVHLCFVAAFLGLYFSEAIVEGYAAQKNELHPVAIRYHYLMDMFVELPLMLGVLVSGIGLLILIDELTTFHLVLIACGTFCVLFCPFCFFRYVRTRRRILDDEIPDEDTLVAIRKRMGLWSLTLFNPLLLTAFVIGFWLAYKRVMESIYG